MGDSDNSSFPERKVEDFYFKQLKKLQIFESPKDVPRERTHLLAVSNKYGLCFAGCPTGVKIIKTDIIGKLNKQDDRNINAVEYPSLYIDIGEAVRHVSISCDTSTLSVCYEKGNNIMMRVYDIPAMCSQTGSKEMLGEVSLSNDVGSSLVSLLWNPAIPNIFAACFSNGSVTMWEMTDTKITKTGTLPVASRATAICWSPKGKQIVVGHKDGHLTQYSPNLELKKETPCPEMFQNSPRQVTSICWISAAVFLNVYTTDEEGEVPQCVLVCNATKSSPKQTINFDDVYFGMNEDREKGFYTAHLSEWNVTLSVSCNAFEVAVFGNEEKWEKWTFEDEKRAEMPLTSDNDETYPMGMAIDLTSTIPIVENEHSYPPAPLLLLLSTDGVLCPFYMVNKNPKAKHDIVRLAEPLPPPGQRQKIIGDGPLQSKVPQQMGGQQQPVFQPPKAAPTAPGTGSPQPAAKPSNFSSLTSSAGSSFFSFTPSSSSKPAADATTTTSKFSFPTPTFGPSTVPVQPTLTEAKAVSSDGVPTPSTKSLFTTSLFGKKSDSTVPAGIGFPFGTGSSFAASTGPSEKPASQLPTTKPMFSSVFSSQQPSTLPSSESPGLILKPMPTAQPLGTPKEADTSKGVTRTGVLEMERAKQQQIKKQEEVLLEQQQKERERQKLLEQQKQEQQIAQLRLRRQEQEQQQIKNQEVLLEQQQKERERQKLLEQQKQEQQIAQLRLRRQEQEQQQIQQRRQELEQQQMQQRRQEQQEMQQQQQLQERQEQERQLLLRQQLQQRQLEMQELEQREQPMTKQNLEISVSTCIFEEIQIFGKELKKLAEDVDQVKNVCSEFAQAEELERLRVETEREAKMCDELKQVAKDHNSEIQDAKKKLLSSFEVLEDARVRHHRAKDRRYLHLLKSRGLDPMNANKMRTIRELYMYLDKSLSEVNLVLDEEWNKENESQSKIQRPTMDAVYRTLQAHQSIAQDQSVRLDKIAEKMKRKKLLSMSWSKPSASIMSSRENVNELSSLSGSMKSLDLETTTRSSFKVPANIPANKSAQLINMLRKRQTTPIRRSMVVSPDTSRAKQIQKRLAKPITNLSPPSRQEHIAAETPSVMSTNRTEPLCSSTPAVTDGQGDAFGYGGGRSSESSCKENAYQTQQQSARLFVGTRNAGQTTGGGLGLGTRCQSTETPPVSTAPTRTQPQTPTSRPLFDKSGFSSQRAGAPPSSAGTTRSTGTPQIFYSATASQGVGSPLSRGTGTPPLSTGFGKPHSSVDKSTESSSSRFVSTSTVTGTKEAALKMPSTLPGENTALKQMLQQTSGSASRDVQSVNAVALAAINRAEKVSAEKSNLDPSASIEPRSMVTHGQSGGERARDIESENIAARSIAEEALKYSQLEAEKAGVKPQSSTEFAFKGTESPKPGPPVVTVKPVPGKDKIPPSNITVKPVAFPATSIARPSIVPSVSMPPTQTFPRPETASFSVPAASSGAISGFSFGAPKDTVAPKGSIGQGTTPKSTMFASAGLSNTKKETEAIPASSLGSESSIQPKSSPLNSGIVKSDVVPSPGVSRRLFKDVSNEVKDTNDQKGQAAVPQNLQKPFESGGVRTSLGFQSGPGKENVPFSAPPSLSSSNKPEGAAGLGLKLGSPFALPKTGQPSFAAAPGKDPPSFEISSGVKPFSSSSSAASGGLSLGLTNTKPPSNVFRPFANIQTSSGSSPTSLFGSTSTSSSSFTAPASFSFISKEASSTTSATSSATVSSGISTSGFFNLTSKTTAASSTTVTSGASTGVAVATSASPFSSFTSSAPGSSKGDSTAAIVTATTAQGGTPQGSRFGVKITPSVGSPFGAATTTTTTQGRLFGTATSSQGGTTQGGLFEPKTTASQGSPLRTATITTTQGGLYGTPTSSQGGTTTQGGLLGTPTSSQGGTTTQGGLFGTPTSSKGGTTTQGGLFATPTSSQGGTTTQGGLFGTPTSSQGGTTTQGGLFGTPTSSQGGTTTQGGLFGTPTSSQGGTTTQGGLFGTPTSSQGGTTTQGGLYGTPTSSQGGTTTQGGLFGTPTSSQGGTTTQGGLFGTPTSSQGGTTTQGGLFGTPTSSQGGTTTQGGLFGTPTSSQGGTTTQGGLFGTPTSSQGGTTTQGGLFGTPTSSQGGTTTQGGLFGTPTSSQGGTTTQGGLFGAKTTTSQGGLFGSATTASQGGASQGVLFGTSQAGTPGGLFRASTTSQSGTGQFGSPSSSTSPAFGQLSFGQSSFGQPTTTVTSPSASAFGLSAFSKPQETTSNGTGLSFGGFGLGGQPSAQANKNPFQATATSSPSTGSSLFGTSTSTGFKPAFGSTSVSSFGSQSPSGFGGGSFSKGTGNVASSGFSLGSAGTGSSGFGGLPSFGSAPSFGSTSSFGSSAPSFGSAPVFGTSSQIGMASTGGSFGSSTTSGGFGNVSGSPTFGTFAQQSSAPSFGNVAQQAQQEQTGFGGFAQQSSGFGGFGSPGGGAGSNPAFGGSPSQSFSQWR